MEHLTPTQRPKNFEILKKAYYDFDKQQELFNLYHKLSTKASLSNTAFVIFLTTNRNSYKLTAFYRFSVQNKKYLEYLKRQNPKFIPLIKRERIRSKGSESAIKEFAYVKLFSIVSVDIRKLLDTAILILPSSPYMPVSPLQSYAFMHFKNTLDGHIIPHPIYSLSCVNMRHMDVNATKDAKPILGALFNMTKDLNPNVKEITDKYYHPMIHQSTNLDIQRDEIYMGIDGFAQDNSNIYQIADILRDRYADFAPQNEITEEFFQVAIEEITTTVPCDQFGFPIVVKPPEASLERIVDNGPKATTGGTDINGEKHTKTNLYFDNVQHLGELLEIFEENVEGFLKQESTREPISYVKPVPLMPLIMSPKNEIIKKKKKVRFFMIIQGVWSLFESAYFGPILDMVKAAPMSKTGGRRIMNGATLDRGVGIVLLNTMIHRNGQDPSIFSNLVKDYKIEKKETRDVLNKCKSIVSDFSSFEFQHNVMLRLTVELEYLLKYTFSTLKEKSIALGMACKTELTGKPDVDLGAGHVLQLAPNDEGSGNIKTLDGNGKTNKIYQKAAAYYLALNKSTEEYSLTNLSNYAYNGLYQGDDGYFASMDSKDIAAGVDVIDTLKNVYNCKIKDDVKPLFARLDKWGKDVMDAGDFLKTKPTITSKGIFFIRDLDNSMMRMIIPNTTEFNASTQLYAAISQMYNSYGNEVAYNIAKTKLKYISELCRQKKVVLSSDAKQTVLDSFLSKMDVKGMSLMEFITVDGFKDLSFTSINELFLFPNQGLIKNLNLNAQCYTRYGLNYDAMQMYFGSNLDF